MTIPRYPQFLCQPMVTSVSVKDSSHSQYLRSRQVASSREGRDGPAEGAVEADSPSESVLTASRLELAFFESQDELEVKQEPVPWLVGHAGLVPRRDESVGEESMTMP